MTQQNGQQNGNGQPAESASLLPEGRYKVKAVDHTYGTAGAKKTKQIGVALEIVEGPHTGTQLSWYGFFTPDSEEFTINGMFALGFDGVDEKTLYSGEAQAVVEHEVYQNKKRAKVQWLNPIGVVMKDQMEGAELASMKKYVQGLAARLKGGANGGGNAQQLPARKPTAQAPQDDIPFPDDDDAPQQSRYRR